MTAPYSEGILVDNPAHLEWGPGKIVHISEGKLHVIFRDLEEQIRALAASLPGVHGIDKCRVRKSGLSHFVDIHVEVDGALTVREGHNIAGAVKHALVQSELHVSDVSVHIEPAQSSLFDQ